MRQMTLFGQNECVNKAVVNVASVPKRSPFRYPGGKTWLVPYIRQWLLSFEKRPRNLIEPFAGGAIIGLTAASERLAEHVLLVELDEDVASVWQTILGRHAKWLAEAISKFEMSADAVQRELSRSPGSARRRAFQTILKNRVFHGGILAPGSGLIKHGENGKGILSRWYPATLERRILNIHLVRDRITFQHGDGINTISQYKDDANAVFFIDPPYSAGGKKAGTRLYKHFALDHADLIKRVSELSGDFLMTYDDSDEIREMAACYGLNIRRIPMKTTHHTVTHELLIGRDFAWLH